jgi:hypothetical protein
MTRKAGLLALVLPLTLVACLSKDEDDDGDDTAADDTGDVTELPADFSDCRAADGDTTDLANAAVSGDTLTIEASYGGGCEVHDFAVCWDQSFAESDPVQVWLEVWHDANGDSCEAYETRTLSFDLTPLKEAWQSGYQAESGTITIHIGSESVTYTF